MTSKNRKMMKNLGVVMAVGSIVAAAGATMGSSTSTKTKKNMKKAVNTVTEFVDSVSSMM